MEASAAAGDPSPQPPRGWLSGLVSGAGRFLSAILDPESSASDTTSSSPESSQSPQRRNHDAADHGIRNRKSSASDDQQLHLTGKEIVLKDSGEVSLAIISEVDPKDAVKQLLMQETYSREECDALVKIIQERVVDSGDEPAAIILPIAWQTNTQKYPVAYSSSPDTSLPAVSGIPAYNPVFDTAVEGWLKKSSAVVEGPCTNNHDRSHPALKRSYSNTGEESRSIRPKQNKSNTLRDRGASSKEPTTNATSALRGFSEDARKLLKETVPLETGRMHLVQKNDTCTICNGTCSVPGKTVFQEGIDAAPSSSMGLQLENSSRNSTRGLSLENSIPTKIRSLTSKARRSNNRKTVKSRNGLPQQNNPAAGQELDMYRVQANRPIGRPRKERR